MRRDTKVYFLATADRSMVKIGCSYFPPNRLAAIQCWSPVKLELIASVPGFIEDERALHAKFVKHFSHGEWFRGHPEIFATAEEVATLGELPWHLRGIRGQANPLHKTGWSKKRTPEQCQRIADGLRAARARDRAKYEEACLRAAEWHRERSGAAA